MPDQAAKTPVLGLYDLSNDISEAHDLSQAHPERVRQLQSAWTAWHKRVGGDKQEPEGKPKAANNAP